MTVRIRLLGPGDTDELLALMDAVIPGWVNRAPGTTGPTDFLADPATFVLGAWDGDEPVGWAYGVAVGLPNGGRMTYLHELDVAEHARRRGIATRLVEASMAWARDRRCHRFWLSTGGHNEVAQAVYESLGGDRKPLGDVNYWWQLIDDA